MGDRRKRRWRLILGKPAEEGLPLDGTPREHRMDEVLDQLYDGERSGGLGGSRPRVARWLGDVRECFPTSVVRLIQKDAIERLDLKELLLEPELFDELEPDVDLVATLLSLSELIPRKTRESARRVVRKLTRELNEQFSGRLVQAVRGTVSRGRRTSRVAPRDIDWHRTILANLKNTLPDGTIVADRWVGTNRRKPGLQDVHLCIDQSGSMARSLVYAAVYASVLAGIRSLRTRLVLFDTSVTDWTDVSRDPVDVLFGAQLGGGTDIERALAYCEKRIGRPRKTILVLVSDLFEGGSVRRLKRRAARLVRSGVRLVALLALSDEGRPVYNEEVAEDFAELGIPTFACTPDHFPDLMAAAMEGRDLNDWAAGEGIVTARAATFSEPGRGPGLP